MARAERFNRKVRVSEVIKKAHKMAIEGRGGVINRTITEDKQTTIYFTATKTKLEKIEDFYNEVGYPLEEY